MKTPWLLSLLLFLALVASWIVFQGKLDSLSQEAQELTAEVLSVKEENTRLLGQVQKLRTRREPSARTSWVSIDDDPSLGDRKAPVTIVEFSEFECPFCARFSNETFPKIKERYIDTGKVRFVFRNYPLPFHEHAVKAAEAAECAGRQGLYWEMNELLFQNHTRLTPEEIREHAGQIGLYMPDFDYCLESGQTTPEIQKDLQDGKQAGISSTPSFLIGVSRKDDRILGTEIKGAKPFEAFQTVIEEKLREAPPLGGS